MIEDVTASHVVSEPAAPPTPDTTEHPLVMQVREAPAGRRARAFGVAALGLTAIIALVLAIPLFRRIQRSSDQTDCRARYAAALDAASGQLLVDQADFVLQLTARSDPTISEAKLAADVVEVRRLSDLRGKSADLCRSDPTVTPIPPTPPAGG